MSITIEQDLKEILGEINQKLEKLDNRLNSLEIGQARLEEKVDGLEKDFIFCKYLREYQSE